MTKTLASAHDGAWVINGTRVRTSNNTQKVISIYDMIRAVNGCPLDTCKKTWKHIKDNNVEVLPRGTNLSPVLFCTDAVI